ncbi:hypothetical protein [Bradyrhizobium sp.]|uniref:hypothetical protein n=1 Tax=Bradyrhizobium sp. TaxID=376 RepID=UPI001EBFA3D1|nr:hypothetical protein [Bradyrhizobium sp.]MBV8771492.1 hypothetical protein [Deltaproteobacteria bacterium]MBV9983478.1 hypothetical protein [Bradyrhizobium sp.]
MQAPRDPLSRSLAELDEAWLDIRCPKNRTVLYPLRLMAQRHGGGLKLRDVLTRLICTCCRQVPVRLVLREQPHSDNAGMAGADIGWAVVLRDEKKAAG